MPADDRLFIRIPADLKQKIQAAALADNRTLSGYVLNAVINQVNADIRAKKEKDSK